MSSDHSPQGAGETPLRRSLGPHHQRIRRASRIQQRSFFFGVQHCFTVSRSLQTDVGLVQALGLQGAGQSILVSVHVCDGQDGHTPISSVGLLLTIQPPWARPRSIPLRWRIVCGCRCNVCLFLIFFMGLQFLSKRPRLWGLAQRRRCCSAAGSTHGPHLMGSLPPRMAADVKLLGWRRNRLHDERG